VLGWQELGPVAPVIAKKIAVILTLLFFPLPALPIGLYVVRGTPLLRFKAYRILGLRTYRDFE
jgi:hypothetical protein